MTACIRCRCPLPGDDRLARCQACVEADRYECRTCHKKIDPGVTVICGQVMPARTEAVCFDCRLEAVFQAALRSTATPRIRYFDAGPWNQGPSDMHGCPVPQPRQSERRAL